MKFNEIIRSNTLSQLRFGALRRLPAAFVLSALLSACASDIVQHGNLPPSELLSRIKPGLHSRDRVADILGSPSSVAIFGDETWYYISNETETLTFEKPKLLEQKVIAIIFDDAGTVKDIRDYGLEDAQEIEPVARITPTGGRSITILEQLIGNLGRFSKPAR